MGTGEFLKRGNYLKGKSLKGGVCYKGRISNRVNLLKARMCEKENLIKRGIPKRGNLLKGQIVSIRGDLTDCKKQVLTNSLSNFLSILETVAIIVYLN